MKRHLFAAGLFLASATVLRADEIRLKDGSKIIGTIVDFEHDSFKVQTAYGFAMVRKDSIAQIIPDQPVKTADAVSPAPAAPSPARAATPAPAATTSPAVRPQPAVANSAAPAGARPAAAATPLPMPRPNPRPPQPAPVTAIEPALASAPSAAAVSLSAPAPPPAPPAPAGPPLIRESVQGSRYINETYNLRLYRPPGWDVIPDARKALPNAITAMGTADQSALFLIGREPARDSLEAQAASSQRALQRIYENYRQISSSGQTTVAGLPAIEWRFRGMAEGHDWSVTALAVARGGDVFILLGMAYADSDPILQIRENVIAKMLASLQFE